MIFDIFVQKAYAKILICMVTLKCHGIIFQKWMVLLYSDQQQFRMRYKYLNINVKNNLWQLEKNVYCIYLIFMLFFIFQGLCGFLN